MFFRPSERQNGLYFLLRIPFCSIPGSSESTLGGGSFLEFQHLFVASGKNNVDGVDGILSDGFKFSSFVPMIITLVDSFESPGCMEANKVCSPGQKYCPWSYSNQRGDMSILFQVLGRYVDRENLRNSFRFSRNVRLFFLP